jgi:ornithine cyclodeaminase/alanine dehydrogenase-like protein (mu-crystallin family)
VLLVIGTGRVARAATVAIHHVQAIQRVIVSGRDPRKRQRLARSLREAGLRVKTVAHVADGLAEADIVVTATASTSPWFQAVDVRPGTTILALGSDAPGKQELPPEILAHAGVVTDSTAQCLLVGELGHAVRANLLAVEKVRAELGAIVAGQARGRMSNEENIVFDSTGTAIADAAMARAVLRN